MSIDRRRMLVHRTRFKIIVIIVSEVALATGAEP